LCVPQRTASVRMLGVHRLRRRLLKANEVRVYVVRGVQSNGNRPRAPPTSISVPLPP
jgi:hypothetical protein